MLETNRTGARFIVNLVFFKSKTLILFFFLMNENGINRNNNLFSNEIGNFVQCLVGCTRHLLILHLNLQ